MPDLFLPSWIAVACSSRSVHAHEAVSVAGHGRAALISHSMSRRELARTGVAVRLPSRSTQDRCSGCGSHSTPRSRSPRPWCRISGITVLLLVHTRPRNRRPQSGFRRGMSVSPTNQAGGPASPGDRPVAKDRAPPRPQRCSDPGTQGTLDRRRRVSTCNDGSISNML